MNMPVEEAKKEELRTTHYGLPTEAEVNRSGVEVKTVFETVPTSRIYFLDNLKVFLAVLVVLHHAAQPYGPGGGWWIPSEPTSIIDYVVLGIFMAFNASFFMGLFFMLSAYFVPSSLERKGANKFMKDRLVKLGVPILIFMIIVFPVMDYLLNYQVILFGHLWFLAMLIIFSTVYIAYCWLKSPLQRQNGPFLVMQLS